MDVFFVLMIFFFVFGGWFYFEVMKNQTKRNEEIYQARREIEDGLEQVGKEIRMMSQQTGRRIEDQPITKEYLNKLTRPEIEDLGQRYDIKLTLYKQKNAMIQDFISQMNDK